MLVHERAAHEKSKDMPSLVQVPQMLAAGWGGNGNVLAMAAAPKRMSASFALPAFFRRADSSDLDQVMMSRQRTLRRTHKLPQEFVQQLETQDSKQFQTIDELSRLGLPQAIALWLHQQVVGMRSEAQVVQAFVQAMLQLAHNQWSGLSGLAGLAQSSFVLALQPTSADAWPAQLMNSVTA